MNYDLILVGAGGFGREVYQWTTDWIRSRPADGDTYRIAGFLSDTANDLDGFSLPVGILGTPGEYEVRPNDRFLIAIGTVSVRKRIVEDLKLRGAQFHTLVHPTAVVGDAVKLGEGVILCPFATVTTHVELSDFVMLNIYASAGHDARVGRYGVLCPYATLNGFAMLEDEVFVATHATVTAYRRIGRGATIGANSLVLRDVPPEALIVGVPGKNLREE